MTGARDLPGPDHSEAYEELAVGWALHALEPEDADLFLAHLDGCARCRQVVEETTEVMAAMAAAAPAAEPPQTLGERLRDEVARTEQDPPGAHASRNTTSRSTAPGSTAAAGEVPAAQSPATVRELPVPRRRWTSVLVAASLAAVIGLGGWVVVLVGQRNDARQAVAAEASMVETILRPGTATVVPVADDDGRTVATLLARDDEVQVVSHGLAANDRDSETYVLWGLDQGAPASLGTFDVTDSGLQLHSMDTADADDFPSYGISVEPGRQAPAAPTDVVARGQLPA